MSEKTQITLGKAARAIGIAPATLRGMCERGEIPGARRIGKWWRIPIAEVERIAREGTRPMETPHA